MMKNEAAGISKHDGAKRRRRSYVINDEEEGCTARNKDLRFLRRTRVILCNA